MHHRKLSAPNRALTLFVCAIVILGIAGAAEAQSGRRIPKRPTTSDPIPPKESDPPPVVKPEDKKSDKPLVPILVAKHLNDIVYSSNIYLDVVLSGFLERMSKATGVKVEPTGKDLNRKEAHDAAASSQDRYVVWFTLVTDNPNTGMASPYPDSPATASYLYIDFVLFSPATGKTKSSGHVYQRQRGSGLPIPTSGGTVEYNLRYAGMEFAERILDSLDFTSTGTTPPIIH